MADEVRYTGYKAEVSERDCADGELAASLNLLNEDGAMRPLWTPKDRYQYPLPSGVKVLYLHRTPEYRHVIVQYTGTGSSHAIAWFDEDNPTYAGTAPNLHISLTSTEVLLGETLTDAIGVESIGNTLVVLMAGGMHYYLYQPANGNYKHLGTHLPELELSFGLRPEVYANYVYNIRAYYNNGDEEQSISESNWIPSGYSTRKFPTDTSMRRGIGNNISNDTLANVNASIANITKEGRFVFPFLVRCAYRLFDQSITMQSAPILMVVSSEPTPSVVPTQADGVAMNTTIDAVVKAFVSKLNYLCPSSIKNEITDWKDIISSVDIFISAPIYTYNQSGKVESFTRKQNITNYTIGRKPIKVPGDSASHLSNLPSEAVNAYGKWLASDCYLPTVKKVAGGSWDTDAWKDVVIDIPSNTDEYVNDSIRNCSNFYLVKSIPVDDLATTRTVIDISGDILTSLVNREVMTDDYDSHDTLIPRFPYVYNQRLNIANLTKLLAIPQRTASYQSWTDAAYEWDSDENDWVDNGTKEYKIWVYTKAGGRDVIVSGEASELGANAPFLYFYYPDPNAYKIVVRKRTPLALGDAVYYELPLKRHDFLNGAVFFEGFEDALTNDHLATTQADPTPSTAAERTVQIKNKIYTSEIGNPFYFPVEGINTVGLGEIVGMSAATNALSEGQFGQFPLYAFTTDGIYALEVDQKNGLFGQVHPIPRDVCINPDSITQTDNSVLFASKRGIMVLSGRQSACISETIATETPFNILTSLPGATKLHELMGHGTTDSCLPTLPFQAFLSGCRMVYDYVRQRVTVFNPSYSYAYVFSKKSKLWGMTRSNLQYGLNSYPEALAVAAGNKIVVVGETTETVSHGLMVTRALKFGAPDILKSVHDIVQRGVFRRGHVKTVLWGSRDNHSWFVVGSSVDEAIHGLRGSGYKYFRIGTPTELTEGETVSGASLNMVAKATTKKLI